MLLVLCSFLLTTTLAQEGDNAYQVLTETVIDMLKNEAELETDDINSFIVSEALRRMFMRSPSSFSQGDVKKLTSGDWENAVIAADLSAAVYNDSVRLSESSLKRVQSLKMISHTPHSEEDIPAYLVAHDTNRDVVYVAIRGSKDPKDWTRNLAASPAPLENGFAHMGFLKSSEIMFTEDLIPLLADESELILTGHSAGGAISVVLGSMFQKKSVKVKVFTFGSPACIRGKKLLKSINSFVYSFVYGDDIVPFLSKESLKKLARRIEERKESGQPNELLASSLPTTVVTTSMNFCEAEFCVGGKIFKFDSSQGFSSVDAHLLVDDMPISLNMIEDHRAEKYAKEIRSIFHNKIKQFFKK